MKKYPLFLLLTGLTVWTACDDDNDTPIQPELNKLTNVSCYKNDNPTPLFSADINYTNDGKISNMRFSGDQNLLFIHSDGKFTVTNVNSGSTIEEYTLSGNVITGKTIAKENPYASNEVYTSDKYTYYYNGSNLTRTAWVTRWPKETTAGYEERNYPEYEKYTWENGNVALFAQSQDNKEIRYEYKNGMVAPGNFPFRVAGSFSPTGFESVTPLNLLYGTMNRNLPSSAYTYTVPLENEVNIKYIFAYTTVGDYITVMTVVEENLQNGETNTYKYTFEYNFATK